MPPSSCQRRIVSLQRCGSPTMINPRAMSRTDIAFGEFDARIDRRVNIGVIFHEGRRLAHATLETIRDIDVKLAEHFAPDEIMPGAAKPRR